MKTSGRKGLLEKASKHFGHLSDFSYLNGTLQFSTRCHLLQFRDLGEVVTFDYGGSPTETLQVNASTEVGDVCKFIAARMEYARWEGRPAAPSKLGGNGKEFEELLLTEAERLEHAGILTMGRYGVQVTRIDDEWMPLSSLPDFEGVVTLGSQFIIEAKVCSQPSFRMVDDKIKPRQVKHMLRRSRFGARCYVMIHFNDRLGSTFYDYPFTVAIEVKSAEQGGWAVWEEFADNKVKGKEFQSITRELAQTIGFRVHWHTPARARILRPDISFLERGWV